MEFKRDEIKLLIDLLNAYNYELSKVLDNPNIHNNVVNNMKENDRVLKKLRSILWLDNITIYTKYRFTLNDKIVVSLIDVRENTVYIRLSDGAIAYTSIKCFKKYFKEVIE